MTSPVLAHRWPGTSPAGDGAFLHCDACAAVHRISVGDRAPVYDIEGGASPSDDLRTFLLKHRDHDVRILHRASDVEIHSHARHDPMRRTSFEVTDGTRTFVVTSGRDGVESPRSYALVPGRIVARDETIDLDVALLQRVVDEALYPAAMSRSRLQWLAEACRQAIRRLPWESFDPVDEDRDHPNVLLSCLPEAAATRLAIESKRMFRGAEAQKLSELALGELRFEIPVVRMQRRYEIVEES
jgi:hypothetical protein